MVVTEAYIHNQSTSVYHVFTLKYAPTSNVSDDLRV